MTNKTTKMDTAHVDNNSAPTGGVKLGNAGGYKKGGKAVKKHFATGGVVDSGHPVAMPKKPASRPVHITELSGTFKSGGKVTLAQGRLQKIFNKENAPAMKAAKKDTNEKYGPKVIRKAYGGSC